MYARLGIASENSGKLVTLLRRTARQVAIEHRRELILCDGSPGIGCPVIASLTGPDMALFVAEPTISARHDLGRVAQLAIRMNVPGMLLVNKADVNPQETERLEQWARQQGFPVVGRVPYDPAVTRAQVARQAVVEVANSPAGRAIRIAWNEVCARLQRVDAQTTRGLVQWAG